VVGRILRVEKWIGKGVGVEKGQSYKEGNKIIGIHILEECKQFLLFLLFKGLVPTF
jgi:hypothetical protein